MKYKYFYAIQFNHKISSYEYIENIETGFIELDFIIED